MSRILTILLLNWEKTSVIGYTVAVYKRSELAKVSGFSIESLRYYEEQGLLIPTRDENNYRLYDENQLLRLRFIRHSKKFAFTLKEIQDMIDHINSEDKNSLSSMVQQRLDETLEEIRILQNTVPKLEQFLYCIENHECLFEDGH